MSLENFVDIGWLRLGRFDKLTRITDDAKKFLSGVNFINILQAAFTNADPESTKKTDTLTVFFAPSLFFHLIFIPHVKSH